LGGVAVLLAVLQDGTVPDMAADTIAKASEVVAPMFFDAFEKNQLPDALTRIGIRQLLQSRLVDEKQADNFAQQQRLMDFVEELKASPIAINTADANEQHYEVPAAFYDLVLGNFSKYSSALYPPNTPVSKASELLDEAEQAMLKLYAERAGVTAGKPLRILDMGCGWGSVSLWFAEHFPEATVRGISNSNSQREWIMAEAKKRGLGNLKIYTGNIVEWSPPEEEEPFDVVISIEMLEHMKNYEKLFKKVASWIKPGGVFFTHIFTHRLYAYHYETNNEADWMTKYFFSGGTMPSHDLLFYFQQAMQLEKHWHVNGAHYGLTSEAWLQNMDKHEAELLPILGDIYGKGEELRWFSRWRGFFLACAECFFWDGGNEWFVSHYRFRVPK